MGRGRAQAGAPEAELPARRGASVPSARRGEVFVCFSKRRLDKTLSFLRLTIFRQYVERSLVARWFTTTVPFGKWVSAPSLTSLAPSLLPGPSALVCGTHTRAQGLSLMCTWRCCHDFLRRDPWVRGARVEGGGDAVGGAVLGLPVPSPTGTCHPAEWKCSSLVIDL